MTNGIVIVLCGGHIISILVMSTVLTYISIKSLCGTPEPNVNLCAISTSIKSVIIWVPGWFPRLDIYFELIS